MMNDFEKALIYYRKSASLGNLTSICNIGTYYRDGVVVQQDFNIAIKYFELALSFGSIGGVNNLCRIYSDPNCPSNDSNKGRFHFKLSIEYCSKEMINDYCWFLLNSLHYYDSNVEDKAELDRMLQYGYKVKDNETIVTFWWL